MANTRKESVVNIGQSRVRPSLLFGLVMAAGMWLTPAVAEQDGNQTAKTTLLTEIHFDPGSAEVTYGARQKLSAVVNQIKKRKPSEIRVVGFTDSIGDVAINRVMAQMRADSVASMLIERGITVPMVIEGKGEEGAPFPTPDNVSEPLNRCVGIIAVGLDRNDED